MPSFSTLWLLKPDPPLVAASPVIDRRRAGARCPTARGDRILDADHLGAERGEESGRAGAGELAGQIADADVAESAAVTRTRFPLCTALSDSAPLSIPGWRCACNVADHGSRTLRRLEDR